MYAAFSRENAVKIRTKNPDCVAPNTVKNITVKLKSEKAKPT